MLSICNHLYSISKVTSSRKFNVIFYSKSFVTKQSPEELMVSIKHQNTTPAQPTTLYKGLHFITDFTGSFFLQKIAIVFMCQLVLNVSWMHLMMWLDSKHSWSTLRSRIKISEMWCSIKSILKNVLHKALHVVIKKSPLKYFIWQCT